jgi:hypothetical protein
MAVLNCRYYLLHVVSSPRFARLLFPVTAYFFKKLLAINHFHHQISKFCVIISLKVLHYVRMVEFIQNCYFANHLIQVTKHLLVKDFYCYLKGTVVSVLWKKYFSVLANANNLSVFVYYVVLFQLLHALLAVTLAWVEVLGRQLRFSNIKRVEWVLNLNFASDVSFRLQAAKRAWLSHLAIFIIY